MPRSTDWGTRYLWVVRSIRSLLLMKLPRLPRSMVRSHALHEAERAVTATENHLLAFPPTLLALFFPSTVSYILVYFLYYMIPWFCGQIIISLRSLK